MTLRSAGILLYRRSPALEVWIAHMGGPFWARKDAGAWSIPKGLFETDEDPLAAAIREFTEEIGAPPPAVDYVQLGEFRQGSGKLVTVFVAETDFAVDEVRSNTFSVEWPPRSGRLREFPEVDDAGWFPVDIARVKLVKGQLPVLDALGSVVSGTMDS
ncbi:MAG: NUDIX domain-containing protein [Rhodoglobus sp.]